MTAEQIISAVLNADGTVTALVGTRIYGRLVPLDKPLPALAIRRMETEYITTMHSAVVCAGKVQIDVACMAGSIGECEALAAVVLTTLGAAGHVVSNRVAEEDAEANTWAVILSADVWE